MSDILQHTPNTNPIQKPFSIRSTLCEAWQLMDGTKTALCLSTLIAVIIIMVIRITAASIDAPSATQVSANVEESGGILSFLATLVNMAIMLCVIPGLMAIALKRMQNEAVAIRMGFQYWHKAFRLFLIELSVVSIYFILSLIAIFIIKLSGFDLSIFFLTIAYSSMNLLILIGTITTILVLALMTAVYSPFSLALPTLVNDNLSASAAIKNSFYLTKSYRAKITLLNLLVGLLPFVIVMPLLWISAGAIAVPSIIFVIVFIVTMALFLFLFLPFSYLVYAVLYKNLTALKASN